MNFYTICWFSPSSLCVVLSRSYQPRFPPQHLFWSDTPIIFNGAEIRMAWGTAEGINDLRVGRSSAVMTSYGMPRPSSSHSGSESDGIWGRLTGFGSGCAEQAQALGLTCVLQIDKRGSYRCITSHINNMVDGDGWKKGCMSREEREVQKKDKILKRNRGGEMFGIRGASCEKMKKVNRGRRLDEWRM